MSAFSKWVTLVPSAIATLALAAGCSSSAEVTPQGNVVPEEEEVRQQIESGFFYNAPEDNKLGAVAGNWEAAFGTPPTTDDLAYVKDVAIQLGVDIAAGKGCAYFDEVFDVLAETNGTDRGRAEYVFAPAAFAWIPPTMALQLAGCLGL